MRRALLFACLLTAAPLAWAAPAPAATPWPFQTLELGVRDAEHGASALRGRGRYGIRYHYLSGGANTGRSWTGWHHGGGSFVSSYIEDSRANGFRTVFSWYHLYESAPARGGGDERAGFLGNLRNPDTMRAYYADLRTFFTKAADFRDEPIVLHVEPDAWGWIQTAAAGDDAASVPAAVASSGDGDLAGLPDNAAGFAQAFARLRDRYAPNVLLAYHLSFWGSGIDPARSTALDDERVDGAVARSAAFNRSLGTPWDLVFAEFTDRDAGYEQRVDGAGPEAIWDEADFSRHARFVGGFAASAGRPAVLWQIPFGNTRMRAMDNTRHHYQDNKVEWLLDDPGGHLDAYRQAGVIALLFGTALPGTTCACDQAGDGVTNPAPVNGNVMTSFNSDDDGGFFHARAGEFYGRGAPGITANVAYRPVSGPLAAPASRPRIRVPRVVRRGSRARILVRLPRGLPEQARVTVEVYGGGGRRAVYRATRLAGSSSRVALRWRVSRRAGPGRYVAKVRVEGVAGSERFTHHGRTIRFRVR